MIERSRILSHHIFELHRGLRHLILFTTDAEHRAAVVEKLAVHGIPHVIQKAAPRSRRINIFFGTEVCVEVVRSFLSRSLVELTAEQDFILGVMLGYDRLRQCERYLRRRALEQRGPVQPRSGPGAVHVLSGRSLSTPCSRRTTSR